MRLTQVTVMALKAEIQVLPTLDSRGRSGLGNCHVRKEVSRKNGCTGCCCSWRTRGSSIKTRVQRAVEQTRAIISLRYSRPCILTGSRGTIPHGVANYDLYLSSGIFAGKVNYCLKRIRIGIYYRGDSAIERGYNDQYPGTDYCRRRSIIAVLSLYARQRFLA